ncbi:putative TIM-barrel fold metal-dependent hydrolase [Kibdelosporangium banguiense]|uniref:TIM-barrel fold metal-dependent hydrolase n=1 Tax=Kibdelosporangium banguiense TaxID=1365924 RepID=A0ABS4T6K8_9PSEU|nr:amidohydrolase family protein [Kibdelosporangium banguiense]MBP2320065.1 putative TIM-barrel fold metal-dependent hydrolase [Kibdelosporangium banguiense]
MRIVDARVRLPQHLRPQQSYDSPALQTEQYDRVLQLSDKVNAGTLPNLLETMRAENIAHAVMHAETETAEPAGRLNESLVKVIADHPNRFTGIGTVDTKPLRPSVMARQVAGIANLGLRGVSLQPAFIGLDIDDRLLYPVYARAEELGLVVALHTGVTYSRMHPIRHERPELLDQVACDFPDLKLIACHAGWPWVTEFCAVARRHPTVYLEFGGLAPKYVARPGTGWDTLFTMMPNVLKDQVLYGTDWPVMAPRRALAEWRASGLPDPALEALFGGNATRLFALAP